MTMQKAPTDAEESNVGRHIKYESDSDVHRCVAKTVSSMVRMLTSKLRETVSSGL